MTRLSLPFCIVLQRKALMAFPVECPPHSGHGAAFSSPQKAMAFMGGRTNHWDWEFKFLSRPTLPELLADLQRISFLGICHNPDLDGSGGTRFSLEQLQAECPE